MVSDIKKLYLVKFFVNLTLYTPILTLFFQSRGLSYMQILSMIAWFMLFTFLLEIPTGAIADFMKRKYTLMISLGCYIVASVLITQTYSYVYFVLWQVLWALAVSLQSGTDQAFTYEILKQRKQEQKSKTVFIHLQIIATAAIMLASVIGSYLGAINLAYPQLFYTIPLVCAIITLATIQEGVKKKRKLSYITYFRVIKKGLYFSLTHKAVFSIISNVAMIAVLFAVLQWLWQPLLIDRGIRIIALGGIYLLLQASSLCFLFILPRIEARLQPRAWMMLSSLVPALLLLVISIKPGTVIQITSILVIASFEAIRAPLVNHYINKHIQEDAERSTIISIKAFFHRLMHIILLPLFGMVGDNVGIYKTIGIIGVVMLVFTFIFRLKQE